MNKISLFLIALFALLSSSCDNSTQTINMAKDSQANTNNSDKYFTAQFFIKPQFVSAFKAVTPHLISNTRKEEGAIFYNCFQSVEDSTAFIFNENFKSQAAFDAHLTTEHFKQFSEAIKNMTSKETVLTPIR